MTVEETDVIDMIGFEAESNEIVLGISDHLSWSDTKHDQRHLYLLQEKINSYLKFIESGEIWQHYPESENSHVRIEVIYQYPISGAAKVFYQNVEEIIQNAGYKFRYGIHVEKER